ncbi:MAG TPA: metal-dependent hydrolase [Chloroflexota bacterium]|nr:metal-dependent hydrolase [Chloroflexota bacterium]
MASPIGHLLTGVGLAVAASRLARRRDSLALWIGAAVASILPDLDWIGVVLGMPTHRVHRRGTHSLLALGALSAGVGWARGRLIPGSDRYLTFAWSVALLSHPILDVLTTSPRGAAHGYGIPLFWPVSPQRWAIHQTIFDVPGLAAIRSPGLIWKSVLPEVCIFGPAAIALILASHWIRARGGAGDDAQC